LGFDPEDHEIALAAIADHVDAMAQRLAAGSSTEHVRRSVRELSQAVREGAPVGPAIARVLTSIRQAQGEDGAGSRRQQRAAQPALERLLNTVQEDLLPALQRAGRL
jgi:hypothetical protein